MRWFFFQDAKLRELLAANEKAKTKREASAARISGSRPQGKPDQEEEGSAKEANFDSEEEAKFISNFVNRRRLNSTLLPDAGG